MLPAMSSKPAKPEPPAEEGDAPPKKSKKKLAILAAVPLLLGGIGAGLWFTGVLPHLLGMKHEDKAAGEDAKSSAPVYVDLPDLVANLAMPSGKPTYIKLQAKLEVSKQEDADKVKQAMPRLQDMFQTYLREMRPEELRGSMGTYRLREELLGRANVAVAPTRVNDVLFTQMLIQ
jgi:flagellar FliL protein